MTDSSTLSLTVRAPAKINLVLGVGRVRADGFHPLDTVYQAIGLYDDVTVTPAEQWQVTVTSEAGIELGSVPLDDSNIAVRAGRALAEFHGVAGAASISIEKGIPVAGGLAGGSADAAATLLALDRLWELDTADEELLELAAGLGSDVPFALIGGTALGAGRGEQVTSLAGDFSTWWVVVPSQTGLSTPAVYAEFDRLGLDQSVTSSALVAASSAAPVELAVLLGNDLTAPALSLRPDLAKTLAAGEQAGALASLLSGSGPTCLFLCSSAGHAQAVRSGLIESGDLGPVAAVIAPGPVAGAHVVEYA